MRHLEGDIHGLQEELSERWSQLMDKDMKSSTDLIRSVEAKAKAEKRCPRPPYTHLGVSIKGTKNNCLIWKSVLAKNKNWQETKNGLTIRGGSPCR